MPKPALSAPFFVGESCLLDPANLQSVTDAKRALFLAGAEYLGGGADAAAFLPLPANCDDHMRVVKLVNGDAGHRHQIDLFVNLANYECLPRIFNVIDLPDGSFVYETERLYRQDEYDEVACAEELEGLVEDGLSDWDGDLEGALRAAGLAAGGSGGLDLHENNIMERLDGFKVVIDALHLRKSGLADASPFSGTGADDGYEPCDIFANVRQHHLPVLIAA